MWFCVFVIGPKSIFIGLLTIALEFTHDAVYKTGTGLKILLISSVWHNNQSITWTRRYIRNNPSQNILRNCIMGKQPVGLHLMKVPPETLSWNTGIGLLLLHAYDQSVLEWRLFWYGAWWSIYKVIWPNGSIKCIGNLQYNQSKMNYNNS